MTFDPTTLGPLGGAIAILVGLFAVGVVITLLVLGFGLIFRLIGRVVVCIVGMVGDVFTVAANVVVAPFNLARALVMLVIGRFARADAAAIRFHQNVGEVVRRIWSAAVQRPLRVVGFEVPPHRRKGAGDPRSGANPSSPMAAAPVPPFGRAPGAPPPPRPGAAPPPPWPDPSTVLTGFPGYSIEGRLPAGGSGARLYVAAPDASKRAALNGRPERVVIKSFAIGEGSTLPQIIRESRSLDAARTLGVVLDHALEPHRFWYAMPHYDGPSLGQLAASRHRGVSASASLPGAAQKELVALVADVVASLSRFHASGLWHKDIKPDNIIVSGGKAQLIDVGLVTPLASNFTLTTHGTEYFRDPEMVRQALRGTKVNQVDGARFDLYSAGAVLYAVLENTFPAHGALSSFSKPSPEALRWIIRRAMAEYSKRYPSAEAMLADLRFVLAAPDLALVRPAALPSMRNGVADETPSDPPRQPSIAELASQAAQEAVTAARTAAAEAMASVRAATRKSPFVFQCRAGTRKGSRKTAKARPPQGWSPWASAAVAIVAIVVWGVKHERSRADSPRSRTPAAMASSPTNGSSRPPRSQRAATPPVEVADLPKGGGKLLVDRGALLAGGLPEAAEANAIAGIGSKGWSAVTDDVDALAALEALRGSTPEVIRAELERRGYEGLVRLEPSGKAIVVKPVSLRDR